jgi:hypothetical protein
LVRGVAGRQVVPGQARGKLIEDGFEDEAVIESQATASRRGSVKDGLEELPLGRSQESGKQGIGNQVVDGGEF